MAHLHFAPGKPWRRKSPAYARLHDQLREECAVDECAEPLPHLSDRQKSKFAASELYRMIGDTP